MEILQNNGDLNIESFSSNDSNYFQENISTCEAKNDESKKVENSSQFRNSLQKAICQPTLCLLICAATFRHAGMKQKFIHILDNQGRINQTRQNA
jgi:hypothetical protein